jgi:hypothetical protein
MRSRFKKVWCGSCATMQFAGECPHARFVDQREQLPADLYPWNVRGPWLNPMLTGADVAGLELRRAMRSPLLLPAPTIWTEYKACSCSSCSIGAPCANLAGA